MKKIALGAAAVAVIGLAACGGPQSDEDKIRETYKTYVDNAAAGENGIACAVTTDTSKCFEGMVMAKAFVGEKSTKEAFKAVKITGVVIAPDGKTATVNGTGFGGGKTEAMDKMVK